MQKNVDDSEIASFYEEAPKHLKADKLPKINEFLEEFQKNSESLKIFLNSLTIEDFSISEKIVPKYSNSKELEEIKNCTKRFVVYRMYFYFTSYPKDNQTIAPLEIFAKALINMDKNDLLIPVVFHESRGLIDSYQSGENSARYLKLSMNIKLADPEKNPSLINIFNEGVAFFRKTINSNATILALKEFLLEIGLKYDQTLLNISLEILRNLKFNLIANACFVGMAVFNSEIYFNEQNLTGDEDIDKARIVVSCYHESAHELVRLLLNSFSVVTPRYPPDKNESLGAGYRLENILFGCYSKMYWVKWENILNEMAWKKESIPLLENANLKNLPLRNIPNPFRSGCEDFVYSGYE